VSGTRRTDDQFSRRARRENYPARSVYKLEEIDRRVRLVARGARVLDLGAAPGSWTLYAAERVGPAGRVVAVDVHSFKTGLPGNVLPLPADVMEVAPERLLEANGGEPFDLVISDLAPHTSGHRQLDQARSYVLFSRALELCALLLRPGGRFVGKIFQGADFPAARAEVRRLFEQEKLIRPEAVRSQSYEIYVVRLGRRQPAPTC